jgi:5-formyltetrahydrofolate cyclo-ligase
MRMADEQIEAVKAALRLRARAQRVTFLKSAHPDAAAEAAKNFFSAVPLEPGMVVAAYWPIRDELDCRPVLTRLMDSGQPVCLPVVLGEEQPLELRLWEQGVPLYPSGFGTLAPPDDAPRAEPDVILMPLLGFDRAGTRLGYGGGYYDRTLASMTKRPRLVGFAFQAQELDFIPREPHDIPLDTLITEQGVLQFTTQAA